MGSFRGNDDNNRFENINNALATIAKNGAPTPFPLKFQLTDDIWRQRKPAIKTRIHNRVLARILPSERQISKGITGSNAALTTPVITQVSECVHQIFEHGENHYEPSRFEQRDGEPQDDHKRRLH